VVFIKAIFLQEVFAMNDKKIRVGVVGCGAISDIYLTNMNGCFSNLEVVACCANHYENAVRKAEQHHIEARTYEEILADPAIDMIVVLTPAPTHYGLIRQALEAGKHVYTEKTMTVSPEEAEELLKLADEKNLYLGAAPDTFLGSALQTARKAIDDGLIGEVTSFQVCANRNLDMLTSLFKFLRLPGGGICYDYGVYYLTALVSLLGPVDRVAAVVQNRSEKRVNQIPDSPEFGQEYTYPNEGQVTAVLQLENGVAGSFTLNGESNLIDMADFTIYGTKGILKLTDPNGFGGEIRCLPSSMEADNEYVLDNTFAYTDNSRGVGVAEMADAILHGRKNRASKEMAYHVLDIISQIMRSNVTGSFEKVTSTCTLPEPFANGADLLA
jgi:predicted dehydrogenase